MRHLFTWASAGMLLLQMFVLGVVAVAGALLFVWSGLYSVAASSGHLAPTRWLLELGMRASVRTHSLGITAPELNDDDLVRLGAAHFHGGCAPCHGAPGQSAKLIDQSMLPAPPGLAALVPLWEDKNLFWIVKNGIKYTGMPAWASQQRDDEVWAVVAFLRRLATMSPQRYEELAFGNTSRRRLTGSELAATGPSSAGLAACARCHGDGEHEPPSALVPRLAGQSKDYLVSALQAYASGTRSSGIMEPVATELGQREIEALATYYSRLSRPDRSDAAASSLEEGRRIAQEGVPAQAIPPCESCHGSAGAGTFPRLAGQSERYISAQLGLWRRGLRAGTPQGAIMAPIARRLAGQQVAAVAAYYGAQVAPNAASGNSSGASGTGSSQ